MTARQDAVRAFLEANPNAQYKVIARACGLTVWQATDAAKRIRQATADGAKPCIDCGVLAARPTATTYAGYCTQCMQKAVNEATRKRNQQKRQERLRLYEEAKAKKASGA